MDDFKDNSFDMVISFDAPISYTWPHQEKIIGELIRIGRKRIMISVSSRLGYLPYKDAVMNLWNDGLIGGDREIAEYENGGVPWCITHTFMPDEMERILKRYGVKNIKLAGPGAYARTLPNELLVKIMKDSQQRSDFLDFCYLYDSNPFVCGMGKDNLFARGEL